MTPSDRDDKRHIDENGEAPTEDVIETAMASISAGDRAHAREIFHQLIDRLDTGHETAAVAHRIAGAVGMVGGSLAEADAAAGDIDGARNVFKRLSQHPPRHSQLLIPAMSQSLAAIADAWHARGRRRDAFEEMQRAVLLLSPYFFADPGDLAEIMAPMVRNYMAFARDAGEKPDTTLVRDIFQAFSFPPQQR